MALLDFLTQDPEQQKALTQGLLSGAFGAMAGRGSRLQAWGQGGLQGLAGYSNSLDRSAQEKAQAQQMERQKLHDQLLQGQIGQMQREQQIAQLPQQFMRSTLPPEMDARDIGTPGAAQPQQSFDQPGYLNALRGLDFNRYLTTSAALQKDNSPIKLSKSERLLSHDGKTELVPAAPGSENQSHLGQLIAEMNSLPANDPRRRLYEQAISKTTTHQPGVSVSYGAPVAGVDASGKPVFFQPDKKGGAPAIIPGVAPAGQKLGEGAAKQVAGIDALSGAVDEYVGALSGWKKADALSPDKRAAMGTAYNNMMLQAKEAYNLGVLNGPDYQILQSVVRDPTSPMSTLISNDALAKQAIQLRQMMQKTRSAVVNQHGGKAASAPTGLPDQSAIEAELARRGMK